ncbi:transcriptional regulator [Streptomyces sp. Ag109_O5-1]|uniref:BTAD domain-containing putative transcriptional regulator n=1 Tax=Streptomyces sp. Ag109_O5-1 TaxID=1938851 RepID=UPI000F923C80|nr:BTAD domain-containing putative transcriptional regulator [Streptomyces sp. Ag109_O5-1]RPE37346.1 transcriptional regulator [Streptomyces sp. Ag109_O5-1]
MKHAGGKEPKPSAPKPVRREVAGLRVGVLGELTVTRDGRPLNLGGPRPRTLFALLVLARGAVVTCDRLIDAMWDEEPPPSAVGALQAYVSRLRRELEPARTAGTRSSVIVREGAGYAIRLAPEEVDAWRFEALLERTGRSMPSAAERIALLTEALGLWRGQAFTGFEDGPWARTEAARLAELREVVRERCLAAHLEHGKHDETLLLLDEAEELVDARPLREERWSLLALAHYRAHGQAEALSVLRRARQTLADRLGIDPGPALRGVEAEVLSHAPRLAAPAPPPDSAPASVSSPALGRLVEREHELEELRHCLSEAVAGRGGLVCVQGPAGIGRSALLAEVGRLGAEWGVRVRGVGAGPEGMARAALLPRAPYDVVRQLLGPEVAEQGGLPAAGATPVSEGQVSDGPDGFDVLHGLYRLTERLVTGDEPSQRPLLLLVDDLEACDTASLRFLAHLLPRIQALPILVVTALRTGEPPAPPGHEQVLADIAQDPTVVHIRPEALSAAGVAHLVRRQFGNLVHKEVVHACHRVSVGLPLLLAHMLGALETVEQVTEPRVVEEAGISAVSDLVLARLDRLPPAAGDVVRAIAVLDGGASLPAVAAFAELSERDVASATAVLVRAEVVRDQYPLAFVHPLAAEAVLRTVPQPELPALRERAAKILDGAGAAPEQIAAHLLLVPYRGDPWVVDVLRTAAARASARGANDAAATLLTRALLEPPTRDVRPAVLLELGRAEALVDGPAAARHLREAYESSPPALGAARLLAQTLIYTGRPGEAAEFAARAAAEYPPATQATAEVTAEVTSEVTSDGTADERQGLLALARLGAFAHGLYTVGTDGPDVPAPSPLGDGPGARMLAAEAAREATVQGLDRAAAIASARFALTERVLLHRGEILSWCTAGLVLHLAGEDVRLLWDETLTYAEQRGSLIGTLSAHLWKGFTQWRHGELVQARRSLGTALEQFGAWGVTPGAPQCRAFLTGVLLDLGDTAGARACLERMRQRSAGAEGARLRAESEARVLIAEGRYGQALAALDGVRQLQPEVVNPVWWDGELLRIRALTGLGERGRAERLAREQLVMARRWGAPGTVGRVLRLLGETRGFDGAAELQEALALAADSPSRLEHTRALRSLHAVTCGDNSGDGVVRRFPPV